MNRKNYVLFDLDGTLTDPKEGITKPVQHALTHFGTQTDDLDSLTPFMGPSLRDSFKKCYGFSDEQAWEGVQTYREYLSARGWVQNKEHLGTKETLEALKETGRVLLVATSRPEKFARKILEYSDMVDYLDFIGGVGMGETRVRKGDVIRYVLEQCGLEPDGGTTGRCVMARDREHDALGVGERGMECVDVFYGYGNRQEVGGYRSTWIVGTAKELRDLLLSL